MAVINPIADGPLDVRDCPNLRNKKGPIENDGNYQLCRCGHSKNKPFCDGTHEKIEFRSFTGYELHNDRVHKYWGEIEGQKVTVGYNPALCSHSKLCWRVNNACFDPSQRPWIQPANAPSIEFIQEKVNSCPSGALEYAIGYEEFHREDPPQQEIMVVHNGPYIVRHVDMTDAPIAEDEDFDQITLCSCGLSENKPYCDGSHLKISKGEK